MHILKFDGESVLAQIAHVRASSLFRQTYAEAFDEVAATAALHFVADQGVYLMSNGIDPKLPRDGIVHAEGFNPKIDEDWWELKRDACGGDDFVERIPDEWMALWEKDLPPMIAKAKADGLTGVHVRIAISPDHIELKPLQAYKA